MVTEPVNELPPLTVLYDEACPLCRREIGVYRGPQPNVPACFADPSEASLPLTADGAALGVSSGQARPGPARRATLISSPSSLEPTS